MMVADAHHTHASGDQPAAVDNLRQAPLFDGAVSDEALTALVEQMEFFDAPSGTVLFRQGNPGDYLYLIMAGEVKISHCDGKKDRLLAVLGPTDHFGELSLLDPGPRVSTAVVVRDSVLARLDQATLQRWISDRPEIAIHLLRVVSRRLRRTQAEVADLLFVDVPGRVANQVLALARRYGETREGAVFVKHNLTQRELADHS